MCPLQVQACCEQPSWASSFSLSRKSSNTTDMSWTLLPGRIRSHISSCVSWKTRHFLRHVSHDLITCPLQYISIRSFLLIAVFDVLFHFLVLVCDHLFLLLKQLSTSCMCLRTALSSCSTFASSASTFFGLSFFFIVYLHSAHNQERILNLSRARMAGISIPWQVSWNHPEQQSHWTPSWPLRTGFPQSILEGPPLQITDSLPESLEALEPPQGLNMFSSSFWMPHLPFESEDGSFSPVCIDDSPLAPFSSCELTPIASLFLEVTSFPLPFPKSSPFVSLPRFSTTRRERPSCLSCDEFDERPGWGESLASRATVAAPADSPRSTQCHFSFLDIKRLPGNRDTTEDYWKLTIIARSSTIPIVQGHWVGVGARRELDKRTSDPAESATDIHTCFQTKPF